MIMKKGQSWVVKYNTDGVWLKKKTDTLPKKTFYKVDEMRNTKGRMDMEGQ